MQYHFNWQRWVDEYNYFPINFYAIDSVNVPAVKN